MYREPFPRPSITVRAARLLTTAFTSLRRTLVKRMGLQTMMRSMTQRRPGCQKMASQMPRAAEGVMMS